MFFDLPKWAAVVIEGQEVTTEEAAQIIVRTTDFFNLHSNDREFEKDVHELAGLGRITSLDVFDDPLNHQRKMEEFYEKHGILELEFLHNYRVMSANVCGPHGWCDWEGNIGCDDHNLGKWPNTEILLNEWGSIAQAFPFLNLTCQVFSGESGDENIKPLVEYEIRDGFAKMTEPISKMEPKECDFAKTIPSLITRATGGSTNWERGCTIPQLQEALSLCETKV